MNKPTPEELQAGIDAAIKTGETPETTEDESKDPEVIVTTDENKPPVEDNSTETTDDESTEDNESGEDKETKTTEEDKPIVDYKQKFTESSREAQIREAKLRKTNEAIDQAAELVITDEDVAKEYSQWDLMSDTEKQFAKESVLNRKRFELIHQASQEGKDIQAWNEKVDTYIDDPKTLIAIPDLEGKQQEFKVFATKPTRRGSDFETLTNAFLFEVEKSRPKHKGKMMETGVGGPNETPKPKSNKISVEDAATLRETNYKLYKEKLKAGLIEEMTV